MTEGSLRRPQGCHPGFMDVVRCRIGLRGRRIGSIWTLHKKAEMYTTEVHLFNKFSCIANILGISLVVAHSFFL